MDDAQFLIDLKNNKVKSENQEKLNFDVYDSDFSYTYDTNLLNNTLLEPTAAPKTPNFVLQSKIFNIPFQDLRDWQEIGSGSFSIVCTAKWKNKLAVAGFTLSFILSIHFFYVLTFHL